MSENLRQNAYYSRILRWIKPEENYLILLDGKSFSVKKKGYNPENDNFTFDLEEIVQNPVGNPTETPQYSEKQLLEKLAENPNNDIKDPESAYQYLANRVVSVGDVIVTVQSGARREVTKVLDSYNGIMLAKIVPTPKGEIRVPEDQPRDMWNLVAGLQNGKVRLERPKKDIPVA